MSTLRQIEANRRNAQKSTGPRTEEGRAAVRLNGVRHGLSAQTLVLPGESHADFEALFDRLEAEYQPSTPTQEILVREIAMASWRLDRLYHIEASSFHMCLKEGCEIREKYSPGLDDSSKLAYLLRDVDAAKMLANLARYAGHLRRSLHQAINQLNRLKEQELKREKQAIAQPKARPEPPALADSADPAPAPIGFALHPSDPPARQAPPDPRPKLLGFVISTPPPILRQ